MKQHKWSKLAEAFDYAAMEHQHQVRKSTDIPYISHLMSVSAITDSVALVGFGTFQVTAKAARAGRNPSTGAAIQIAARNAPTFKAGKTLKDKVN